MIHVAVCDDNVADRKQSERLLHRESDRRLSTGGNFYIDSYGNAESLLANPMRYEVYFLDICGGSTSAVDILCSLSRQGISTPVVLCCSRINYRELDIPEEEMKRVIFIDKPLKAEALANIIDEAQRLADKAKPFIELRVEKQTHYVTEEDILYCTERGHHVTVALAAGEEVVICTSATNLYSQWEQTYETFFMPSPKVIINGRHIKKTGFHSVTMKDGHSFSVPFSLLRYAKAVMNEYQ